MELKNENIVRISRLQKSYIPGMPVLEDVSLEVNAGEVVLISGKSGCGKSTLLNIVGHLEYSDGGSYCFLGREVTTLPKRQGAQLRNRVGFVFQNYHLINELSVYENIRMPLMYGEQIEENIEERILWLMSKLDIVELKRQRASTLSGGQKQRVAIARALVKSPQLIIADEPTGNLDDANAICVKDILFDIARSGCGVLVVSHDMELFENADRKYHIQDGILIEYENSL